MPGGAQGAFGDRQVIASQIQLGVASRRKQHFGRIGNRDLASVDRKVVFIRLARHVHVNAMSGRMQRCGADLSARESLPLFEVTEGLIRRGYSDAQIAQGLGGSANRGAQRDLAAGLTRPVTDRAAA
jgi:hypothetical protein